MTYRLLPEAVVLGVSLAACAREREEAFSYPKPVLAAQEQQHYKTALWCAYTGRLDSAAFAPDIQSDSLRSTLKGWLAVPRRLKELQKGAGTTCFRFELVGPSPTILRLYNNGHRYGRKPFGMSPVVAVWVNNKDGLVDSVLNSDNVKTWPGPAMTKHKGKWRPTGPPNRHQFTYNLDQPCKKAFLKANEAQLGQDLLLLCREKGIVGQ